VLLWRDISVDGADAQRYNVNTKNISARLYNWLESIADCDSDVMCSVKMTVFLDEDWQTRTTTIINARQKQKADEERGLMQ